MYCELCGKETDRLYKVRIEGAILEVCKDCAKLGVPVREEKRVKPVMSYKKTVRIPEVKKELAENYNVIIRRAREKLNISLEVLAKALGIKESLLRKIENKELIPEDKLVKKLEKYLEISLYEDIPEVKNKKREKKELGLTIGDVVKIKSKKSI